MSIVVPMEGFGGSGGASLNFDIKTYATEDLLLAASPKDNIIGVITTTPISSWIFSATEPETPAEGQTWIFTGTSSTVEFNALKKNGIQVYPIYAKQYVSGAWVDVTAKSYQNGAWADWWNGSLYDSGNEIEFITGGWVAHGYAGTVGSMQNALEPSLTKNIGNMYATIGGGNGIIRTANKIDVTGFSILRFDGILSANWNAVCVWKDIGTCWNEDAVASNKSSTNNFDGVLEVDLSSVSGECYIGIGMYYHSNVTVRSMKLL